MVGSMFDTSIPLSLELQLGRPLWAWWTTYYVEPDHDAGPDHLLRAEVRGFIEQQRRHAASMFGGGLRSDHIASLLSAAGMLANDMQDLEWALRQIADWYDLYSPRDVRREIARQIVAEGHPRGRPTMRPRHTLPPRPVRPNGLLARLRRMFASRAPRHDLLSRPGRRPVRIGSSKLMLGIGHEGGMQMGVLVDGNMWVIMEIHDRDDRGPRNVPQPTPELIA